MRETRRPGNYPCHIMLHAFKFHDVIERNIIIKGIAINKCTANKRKENMKTYEKSFCRIKLFVSLM